jgi:Ca2+-binding EF-hand superfamily protein
VLIKSFKYFDLNDSGAVEPDEFAKAIEKIGIMIPTKQVSKSEGQRFRLPQHSFPFPI